MNPTISNAARMLAKRRARKLGHEGLSQLARDAAELKRQKYGDAWPKRVQLGERLEKLPPQGEEV